MLKEVEIIKHKGMILDKYRINYKHRYGNFPLELSKPDVAALERLVDQSKDFAMLCLVLEHYFDFDGDNQWYLKQAHDVQTFVTNLKKIYANYLLTRKKEREPVFIEAHYYCDYEDCGAKSTVVVDADVMTNDKDRFIVCPMCKNKAKRAADKIESVPYVNKSQMRAVERAKEKQRNSTA